MGPEGTYLKMLQKLAYTIITMFFNILKKSCQSEVQNDWRKKNTTFIFQKDKEEDLENHRVYSLGRLD